MTDLLSIGASGINVYQRALATVSNNIANLNTEGYSRQTTDIKQSRPVEIGNGFLGTGAYFDKVSRQYDSFIESSLRQATADLESQDAAVDFTNRLLDVLGDEKIGLTSALNQFFTAAKSLSTDPASPALRGIMLRETEALVSRFNGLDDQLVSLGDQAISALEADVESINALAGQIASVNKQMIRARTEADQAPELLDRRDQLLRDISEYVGIEASIDTRGTVSIALGRSEKSAQLVSGGNVSALSVVPPDSLGGAIQFRVDGMAGNEFVEELQSGSASGYARFYEQTLTATTRALSDVTEAFASEVNAVQTTGLDADGNIGQAMVGFAPQFLVEQTTVAGQVDVNVRIEDLKTLSAPESLRVTFNASNSSWAAVDSEGQQQFSDSNGLLRVDGLSIQIQGSGQAGDEFVVMRDARPARDLQLLLSDGSEIAAASFFRATPNASNSGVTRPTVSYEPQKTNQPIRTEFDQLTSGQPTSVSASTVLPVTRVPAGQSEVEFRLDPAAGSDVAMQIITRDGRHLVGTPNNGTLATQVARDERFAAGATFDATYLNASGLDAYKDFELFYGARGKAEAVTGLLPLSGLELTTPPGTDLTGGRIEMTLEPVASGDALSVAQSAVKETAEGAVSVLNDIVYLGRGTGQTPIEIARIDASYTGNAQSLVFNFSESVETSLISSQVASVLGSRLQFSTGRDLTIPANDVKKSVAVDLVDATGSTVATETRGFLASDLIDSGAVTAQPLGSRATLTTNSIGRQEGAGRSVIDGGAIKFNGVEMTQPLLIGDDGTLSANDVKAWLDTANTSVSIAATNSIRVAPDKLQLDAGLGLKINGQAVVSQGNGSANGFVDDEDLVTSINAVSEASGVFAAIDLDGHVVLQNVALDGANIEVSGLDSNPSANALGVGSSRYVGQLEMTLESTAQDEITLELIGEGRPADLNAIGLDTIVSLKGSIDEDLLVYVDGSGSASMRAEATASGKSVADGLRERQLEFQFISNDRVRITDRSTDTVLAERPYRGEVSLTYQGIELSLDKPARIGDVIVVDGNNLGPGGTFDAQGNNTNVLRMVDLEKKSVLPGDQTLTEGYLSVVSDLGNSATQAQISRDALEVVQTQAYEARDRVSGVNLDKEAADLIRFQQAYQASAQVMQVATRLFDAVLQVR
jgi:flagellar hook-associated protein FlgK